jgi:ComEC/Rec2-related protein
LVVAAGVGVVAAEFSKPSWFSADFLLVSFAVASLVVFCRPRPLLSYLIVAFGFFALHSLRTSDTCGLRLAQKLGERPRRVNAVGRVLDEPKQGRNGFATFPFKLAVIDFGGRQQPTSAVWLVRWRGQAQPGDELRLTGIAEPIDPPRNPGEFDMRAYLNRRDIRRQLFIRYAEDGILIRRRGSNPILRAAQNSRDWIQRVICRSLDDSPDVQAFLSGIALGIRHETFDDIEEPFQQTGTLHLFAVAGLHVGIVASLLWIIATVAQVPKKCAAAVIIPLVLFYAAVTGLHVSSVRASLMTCILLGGLFFERRVFAFNSLAAAAFVLAAWDTNELFSTGFQLSFAVVGTIVAMTDPLICFGQRLTAPDPFLPRSLLSRARRFIIACANWMIHGGAVSLAAWLGSLALVLWYFHLVTPISLSANLIVVPIAFFILAVALLSVVTAPLSTSLSIVFNNANWFLAKAVLAIVQWFAQIPASHYYIGPQQLPGSPQYRITVLDVGTGAACHLHVPGADWLFDCGSERDYGRVLRDYLHAAGVNRIKGILLTHGDSLHIGGAAPLMTEFSPAVLIDNPAADRSAVHHRLTQGFRRLKIEAKRLAAGANFDLGPSVRGKILFPPPNSSAPSADDQTLVVQVSFPPATKILFMSDSGLATEDALISSGTDLRSDILIKGQHHSGRSESDRFLEAVRPKLIVATSRDFPVAERIDDTWAEGVRARGLKLFRQDETGAVQIGLSDGRWTARAYVTGETFRSDNR